MTAFCEIIAYWYLCAVSPISQVFPQEHKGSIPSVIKLKSSEKCLETISQSLNMENGFGVGDTSLFIFVPYNDNLWFFSTIIFGKIWEWGGFPANCQSSLLPGCITSNHYLGESLIKDARTQTTTKRWKGKREPETKEHGRGQTHVLKTAT